MPRFTPLNCTNLHFTTLLVNFQHTFPSVHHIYHFSNPLSKSVWFIEENPKISAGNRFESGMILFTKEYFLISFLCILFLIFSSRPILFRLRSTPILQSTLWREHTYVISFYAATMFPSLIHSYDIQIKPLHFAPCLTHVFVPPCRDPSTEPNIQESDVEKYFFDKKWLVLPLRYIMSECDLTFLVWYNEFKENCFVRLKVVGCVCVWCACVLTQTTNKHAEKLHILLFFINEAKMIC